MSSGIYQIKNELTNGVYIGSSLDIEGRFRNHLNQLRNYTHINSYLQYDYWLFGAKVFTLSILYEVTTTKINLLLLENKFINQTRNCYNVTTDNVNNKYTRKWERKKNSW